MYKILLHLLLLVSTWLTTTLGSLAQPVGQKRLTTTELQQNLALIAASTEGQSEAIDRLTEQTARELVTYLSTHELSTAAAQSLGLEVSIEANDAAHLKVYTYSYAAGGTRGRIHCPIFQWKNAAGQLFARRSDEECAFSEIHKLAMPDRTLYLLLGQEQDNSQCLMSEAYVIELLGNELLRHNGAFGKSPALSLCNIDMAFEASEQVLCLSLSDDEVSSLADNPRLAQRGYHLPPGATDIVLMFQNGRFVQKR